MLVLPHHTIEELQELIKRSRLGEERTRLEIIIRAKKLIAAKAISQSIGLSRKGIHYWINRYNECSIEGLKTRTAPGKKRRLTAIEQEILCQRIEQGPREEDHCCTFHGKVLQKVLRDEIGKVCCLSSVYYLLHALGYACLQPRPRHYKSSQEAQELFKKNLPEEIAQVRKSYPNKNVEVWFEDEARFGQQGTLTKVWAKRGSRPTAIRQTEYNYLYILSAVCPASGKAEALFFSHLDTKVMNHFLKQLSMTLAPDQHMILILDRTGYHVSKKLRVPSNITLKLLPPFSPELNPVENLWHYLRSHYWANRYYKDIVAVEETTQQSWDDISLNQSIIQSVCHVEYAH